MELQRLVGSKKRAAHPRGADSMSGFFLRRVLNLIPTLLGISLISFFLMQLAPGGPIDQMADLNPHVTPEVKARIRHDMGLDKPIYLQYGIWLSRIARF